MNRAPIPCLSWRLCAGLLLLAAPALAADGLDVKTGLWETTITTQMQGTPPVPPSVLEKMSPEQRARMLAAARQAAARGPQTFVEKSCVTAADLQKGAFKAGGDDEEEACTYKVTAQTRSLQQMTVSCKGEVPRTAVMRVEALDREHVKGTVENDAGASRSTLQISGRWLGSDCKGVDD